MEVLLDRDAEQQSLERLLLDAEADNGRAALLTGPAGIGKTALLEWFSARAAARGVRVLGASAAQAAGAPYSTIRGLLEPPLAAATPAERRRVVAGAAAGAGRLLEEAGTGTERIELFDASAAACRTLFWLTVNLAAGSPLALCCDDAQWADPASERVLAHLAQSIAGTPIILVVAVREEGNPIPSVVPGEVIRPMQLGADSVAAILAGGGVPRHPGLAQAALAATGGLPLMAHELARALAGRPADPEVIRRDGARMARARAREALGGLPAEATALAQAVAVLGRPRPIELVTALAGLDRRRAEDGRRALERADLLRAGPALQLAHPLVTEAVLALASEGDAARLQLRAARLLEQAGEDGSPHLLNTSPAPPYAWGREVLSRRGRRALSDGAPEAAAVALRAALRWRPTSEERETLSLAAARAEIRAGRPAGLTDLLSACRVARDGRVRTQAALEAATVLHLMGDGPAALDALETTVASLDDDQRPLVAELEASWLFIAANYPELAARAHELARRRLAEAPLLGVAGRARLGAIAFLLCAQGREPVSVTSPLARRALDAGQLFNEVGVESSLPILPLTTLAWADCYEDVTAARAVGMVRAEKVGSALGFCLLRGNAADTHFRRGDLREAEADARASLETLRNGGLLRIVPAVVGYLIAVLIERGELTEGGALLALSGLDDELPDSGYTTLLLLVRGQLRIEQGRLADAVRDLRRCGERADRGHPTVPAIVPWRSSLAAALRGSGAAHEAAMLIDEELELARAHGAPRAIGHVLRVAGTHAGADGEDLLLEAIEMLGDASALLERAHASYALGRLRLDRGQRHEARPQLREALDHAHSCGALPLSTRARAALLASGARPRRPSLTGPDALTATERRISTLAADGMTNAEIAQSQFTTLKTVEKHLTNAFRKLGTHSRRDLPPLG